MKYTDLVAEKRILLIGAALQVGIAIYFYLYFDAAILRLFPDDTFYYLKIAQNIANGMGSSFSAGQSTNGYHPLWMAILVVVQTFLGGFPELSIFAVLLIAIVLNLVAAQRFARLLDALGFALSHVLLGMGIYLLSPWMVNLTLAGLETSLYLLLLFEFLLCVTRLWLRSTPITCKGTLYWGAISGLLMLARTDAIFFSGIAYSGLLIARDRAVRHTVFIAGLLATLILAPWLLWNWLTFGTIVQSSSVAISFLHHASYPSMLQMNYWRFAKEGFENVTYWAIFAPLLTHTKYEIKIAEWSSLLWLSTGVMISVLAILKIRRYPFRLPFYLWLPSSLLLLFYITIRLFAQVWHLSSLFVVVIALFLNFLPRLSMRAVGIMLILLIPITMVSIQNGYFRPQEWTNRVTYMREIYPFPAASTQNPLAQNLIAQNLIVCHTDSGIPGYFSKHTVVNMDGVVNNAALSSIRQGRFSEYVEKMKCDLLIMDASRLAVYDRNMAQHPTLAAELSAQFQSMAKSN